MSPSQSVDAGDLKDGSKDSPLPDLPTEGTVLNSKDAGNRNQSIDSTIDRKGSSPGIAQRPMRNVFSAMAFGLILFATVVSLIRGVSVLRGGRQVASSESKASTVRRPMEAKNWDLNFPRLYPPLIHDESVDKAGACQAAWESLSSIPCHEKVFNRGWDNGTWMPLMSVQPLRYVPLLCQPDCRQALHNAYELISAKCSDSTTFDTAVYIGTFSTEWLESGPKEALQVLLRRNEHTCRPSRGSGYDYCLTEMTERWGIMDGLNAATLNGLDMFLGDTNKRRTEQGRLKSFTRGDGRDGGWKGKFSIQVPTLRYGPRPGETDCGSCTLQWLEKMVNGWEEGKVISPDTDIPITLPEHLRRVKKAGERCETEEWTRIYLTAITRYQKRGLIPVHWEAALPSGDHGWTIQNGLASGDALLVKMETAYNALLADGTPSPRSPKDNAIKCLANLSKHIEGLPCDIHLDQQGWDFLARSGRRLLGPYCGDTCTDAIMNDHKSLKICRYKRMDRHPTIGPFLTAYEEGKKTRNNLCRKAGKTADFCAPVLVALNQSEWAYEGRASLKAIEELVNKLESEPIPDPVKIAVSKTSADAWNTKETRNWRTDLKAGVCSPCVWELVVGNGTVSSAEHILRAEDDIDKALVFAERFYDTCVNRGAWWMGGRPYGEDDIIWRVKESTGDVYRYIIDNSTMGHNSGKWFRHDETTNRDSWMREKAGSIWHLRAAARRQVAEREGRLADLIELESKHAEVEDAKVWEFDDWSGPRWKKQPPQQPEESGQPREL
ncbi:hypothetical protein SUNI508_09985 [Seiridium unicorne]|uniref:Uncharacterized protein n=1 Tax=Seiridium unicorne TaxID=138068 RepID=A0ABR2UNI6_9PEZI